MANFKFLHDWYRALGVFSVYEFLLFCLLSFILGVATKVTFSVEPVYLSLLLLTLAVLIAVGLGVLYVIVRNRVLREYKSRNQRHPTEEHLILYETRWYAMCMLLSLLGYLTPSLLSP